MASITSPYQIITQIPLDILGIKQTTIDLVGGILCKICRLTFTTKPSYDIHYRSHGATDEIIYTCNICYKDVAGFPSFRGHCYTSHVIKDRFQCEHCSKQFSKISNLKEHVDKIHKFKCPTCRKQFPSKKEMLLHQIIHNGLDQPPYKCNTCNVEIETADECKQHIEKHLKFIYACPICNENLSEKDNATDHMKTHFDSDDKNDEDNPKSLDDASEDFRGIMCQFCSMVLEDRVKFDAHFSCKHGDEDIVYMCVECEKTFEKYSVFRNHCSEHSLKNKHKCELCKKSFPRLSMLAAHTAACQAAGVARGQKVFPCATCGRRFASMSRWREHLRRAHKLEQLSCQQEGCDEIFETPKQLFLHQQSHEITNEKFCSQCRIVFPNVAACERHIDAHKKKVYYCPVCKRNAKDKKYIMKHISQHFEVMSHLCRVCGRVFNSKRNLIQHLKTHKKVKSFSCTHCTKSFLKPSQLEQHVNTHTGVKPYKCPVCSKSFTNYPNWVKHVRRMHHEESLYMKTPIVDEKDGLDDDGLAMEAAVDERDEEKSNDTCTDNNKVNDDDEVSNAIESISHTNIELNVNEVKPMKISNAIESISHMNIERNVNEEKPMKISNAIESISHTNIERNVNEVKPMKTIDMIINEAISGIDDEPAMDVPAMDVPASEKYGVPTEFVENRNIIPVTNSNEQITRIELKVNDINHNNNGINIVNFIHVPGAIVLNNNIHEPCLMQKPLEVENKPLEIEKEVSQSVSQGVSLQKADIEHVSVSDEQISSTSDSSKPHKCPICEKTFAKYSYMSKHVSRVHHIRSIDIKNLIIEPKDCVDGESQSSAVETKINDEHEMSSVTDSNKVDTDEKALNIKNRKNSNVENEVNVDSRPHKCPFCDKTYAKYPYMMKHVRKIHHKKSGDIQHLVTADHTASVDETCTVEKGFGEENNTSMDNTKEDIEEPVPNTNSHLQYIDHMPARPHKCPLCDKSFAKYPYMTKHVRKIHNQKINDIIKHINDHKDSTDNEVSAMDTSVDGENDISLDNIRDDNSVQTLNIDKQIQNAESFMTAGFKPSTCSTCEKSFAKHTYMGKYNNGTIQKNDGDWSPMETVVDEETEISTDYSKDDYDEQTSNIDNQFISPEHHMDMGHKPYKCPMCEKSFAQDRYCRKHVRRVHYKKNAPSPIYDRTKTNAVGMMIENDLQTSKSIDYLQNGIPSIGSISNIINGSDSPVGLNDIDDANASLDFANVKLENYMFNVQRGSPMDIVPSMPGGKYLINENCNGAGTVTESSDGVASIPKDLLYTGSAPSTPLVRELFNENGEEITVVEKDLFNNKEASAIPDHLYRSNSGGNDNPIDILEYIAEMPENNSLFVPVISQEALAPIPAPAAEAVSFPYEYGPEFSSGLAATDGFIDLDDHMLPHIDPLLTISNEPCVPVQNYNYDCNDIDASELLALGNEACDQMYAQSNQYADYNVAVAAADYQPSWDPPIITKLCDQYAYGYGEMPEASRVPIMNTDIF